MALLTWRQLHGVNELVQDAVEATTNAVAEVDRDIFRRPYAVLKRIPITADSADTIEQVHETISAGVYDGIRAINRLAGRTATGILDRMEESEKGGLGEGRIRGEADQN